MQNNIGIEILISKNLGNDVLHKDIGQKMTKLESRLRAAAILDAILNYGVCPSVAQWYSLVSENTPPKDRKHSKSHVGHSIHGCVPFPPDYDVRLLEISS